MGMITERQLKFVKVFTEQGENGNSGAILTKPYRNAIFSICTSDSAAFNIKVKAYVGDVSKESDDFKNLDFTAAPSETNKWNYIGFIDYTTNAFSSGNIGYSYTGTDKNTMFELNTNNLDMICFEISGYSAGSITVGLRLSDNS